MRPKIYFSQAKAQINRNPILRTLFTPVRFLSATLQKLLNRKAFQVLERASCLIEEDVVMQVREFHGAFGMSPRSRLFRRILFSGSYEPELVALVEKNIDPLQDAIDVGANIGFYSVLLANLLSKDRKVLAIEPTSAALKRLKSNLILNQVQEKVIVFEGGASNTIGQTNIRTFSGQEEFSTLGRTLHPAADSQTLTQETIRVDTVDRLVEKYNLSPAFIKIDVEGVEPLVLQGMTETIGKYRPLILMEWDSALWAKNGFVPQETLNWLISQDYYLYDPLLPDLPLAGNLICVPEERLASYFFVASSSGM